MRNLKRVLSLALALVMVLGMMVITTSAATYTDADEITYTEAVDVMSAIGILKGNPNADGTFTFDPQGKLTREGAAKILAFICLGTDADDYLTGATGDIFTDVAADRWSAKYVAYCKNLKIIDGNGDGTFNPTGNISTVGFGKLLLGAVGIEGTYTGDGWENNVKAALEKAELDVITIDATDITREEACEMALAAMKYTATAGYTYYAFSETYDTSIECENMDQAILIAAIKGDDYEPIRVPDTSAALLTKYYNVTWNDETGVDSYGRGATVYTHDDIAVEDDEWTLTYVTEKAVKTYTAATKAEDIAKDLKGYKVGSYAVENTEVKAAWSGQGAVRVDGADAQKIGQVVTLSDKTLSEALAALTGDNKVVEIYADNTKAITKIVIVNTLYSTVAEVSEPDDDGVVTTTLTDGTTYKTDAYKQGDVVMYTKDANGVVKMEKIEGFTGTLTSYTKDSKFTVNSKVYELSEVALVEESNVIAALGKEQVYTLDVNGKILTVADPEGVQEAPVVITDYAYVLDVNGVVKHEFKAAVWPATEPSDTITFTAQIQVLLADGTVEIWDVPVVKADKVIANTDIAKGDYYFCPVGKTPVKIAVTAVEDGEDVAGAIETDSATLAGLLEELEGGVYTYADKALVAAVSGELADDEKAAILAGTNESAINATSYVVDGVILNDKTVFVLKELDAQEQLKGYIVKTGLAALESTEDITGAQVIVAYTPAFDKDGELDEDACTIVATLVFAPDTAFDATEEDVVGTDDYVFVDENYTVSVDGEDTIHTYSVIYADGTAGTIAVVYESGDEVLETGVYKLNSDGSVDTETGIQVASALKVKIVSGTTVIFNDDSAMTTNAKTVVIGGELAVGTEAYVVAGDNSTIALAFIVE